MEQQRRDSAYRGREPRHQISCRVVELVDKACRILRCFCLSSQQTSARGYDEACKSPLKFVAPQGSFVVRREAKQLLQLDSLHGASPGHADHLQLLRQETVFPAQKNIENRHLSSSGRRRFRRNKGRKAPEIRKPRLGKGERLAQKEGVSDGSASSGEDAIASARHTCHASEECGVARVIRPEMVTTFLWSRPGSRDATIRASKPP
eukprot:scaffold143_cov260-Pinguiococcus_pyrenoidosus.AAC.52